MPPSLDTHVVVNAREAPARMGSAPAGVRPRVSVGVPVFDGERYLALALDALLSQTFADLEIIISDNGSSDGTEAIGRQYAARDPRVRYYRAAHNHGLAWNFNRVVELARGEYFKWAAYDDLCEPTYVERCVEVLDAHADVVWCHSCGHCIDAVGRAVTDYGPLTFMAPVRTAATGTEGVASARSWTRASTRPHQRFLAVITGPSEVYDMYGLMRLEALRRTGRHRPFFGADRVLIAELSLMGRYAEVPDDLFLARRHAEQTVFRPRHTVERQTSGRMTQRWFAPHRLHRAWWMLRLVITGDIGLAERLRCLATWGLFALHPRKWKRFGIDALRASGVHVPVPEDIVRRAAGGVSAPQPSRRD